MTKSQAARSGETGARATDPAADGEEKRVVGLVARRLLPFLALIYVVAYIDRTVVGFAKLHMNAAIGLSDAAYGLGAGLFFIGYFLCEVPSNLALSRFGARVWFARILFTWGAITMAMAFVTGPNGFYALRFLLGAAEAGLYPGILYFLTHWFPMRHRARVIGLLVLAQPIAGIITGPISGLVLEMHGVAGLANWQMLFVLSGLPAVLLCWPTLRVLPDTPAQARWLADPDRALDRAGAGRRSRSLRARPAPEPVRGAQGPPRAAAGAAVPAVPAQHLRPVAVAADHHQGLRRERFDGGPALGRALHLFAVIGLLIVPRHSDRHRERHWHIVAVSAFGALAMAASAWFRAPALQLLFICLTAFSVYSIQAVVWALPGQFLTGPSAAVGIATINSIANLGGYLGPYGIGLIKDATGSLAAGLYFLAATLLVAVLMAFAVRAALRASTPAGALAGDALASQES